MSRQLRVFLCHAREDQSIVNELYRDLKAENWIDPWLDKEKILPGQDWQTVIEQAVDEADVIIICLSHHSVFGDGYVQKEIRYAYDCALGKNEASIFLIPLRLDDIPSIPRRLHAYHWVDYFGAQKQNEYLKLLASLHLRYEQKIKQESLSASVGDAYSQQQTTPGENKQPVFVDRGSHIQTNLKLVDSKSKKKPKQIPEQQVEKEPAGKKTAYRFPLIAVGFILFSILCVVGLIALGHRLGKPKPIESPALTELPVTSEEPTAPPSTVNSSTPLTEKDGMTMIYIQAGESVLGSDQGDADEKPLQTIFLDEFWIDQTEITNKKYAMCVADNSCAPPSHFGSPNEKVYYGNDKYDDYPVVYVNWDMAKTYCQWAGRDLPTEFQWEKAARGVNGLVYPWGDKFNGVLLNYCDESCPNLNKADGYFNDANVNLAPVGYYLNGASAYDVLDMSGNVWEWVNDWYDVYPNGVSTASTEFGQKFHVIRGGSWQHNMYEARSSNRWYFSVASDALNDYTGFRCVRSQ